MIPLVLSPIRKFRCSHPSAEKAEIEGAKSQRIAQKRRKKLSLFSKAPLRRAFARYDVLQFCTGVLMAVANNSARRNTPP